MNSGAMSFLIEVGDSFQPPFRQTQAEEQRVWPGLKHVLTTWAPAVRGFVNDATTGSAIESSITYTPRQLFDGESLHSRQSDGRFGLWLPKGTHDVTFSAPGYAPQTKRVTVEGYNQPQSFSVELESVHAS